MLFKDILNWNWIFLNCKCMAVEKATAKSVWHLICATKETAISITIAFTNIRANANTVKRENKAVLL